MTVVDLPEPAVIILIGAAGAGKSTLAARSFPADEILSSDDLRRRVSGDAANQFATARAFAILHQRLVDRLREHRSAVIDATNATARARRAIVARRDRVAPEVPIVAVVLDLPAGVVADRNAARARRGERAVPEHAVRGQLAAVRRTLDRRELYAEGFSQIIVVTSAAELDALVLRRPNRD